MDGTGGTDAALTLPGTLRRTATVASLTNPDAGVVTAGERAPWGRVLTGAEGLAARLAGLGVPEGARVGLLAGNSVAGVEMLFACGMLGAVCVPVPGDDSVAGQVLADAVVDTLVTTPDLAGRARAVLPEGVRAVVVGADEPGFARVDDEPGPSAPFRFAGPGDVALLAYTAGTTGAPRGCALTHGTLVAAARALGRDRLGAGPEDVLWNALPLSHLGFVTPLLAVLDAGGTVVTGGGRERVTVAVTCSPAVTDALLDDRTAAGVRLVLDLGGPAGTGAGRSPRAVRLAGYGCAETAGVTAVTRPGDPDDDGTHGPPLPGLEVAVVDPDTGTPLPSGEPGEILVRGPGTSAGYHGDAPRDAGSWFRTGDLGLLDARGRLTYRGRLADTVTVGGEAVAAGEVESVLAGHPAVRAAAVVAAPDPEYTQVPAAFVELLPGAEVTADALREHCASELARFKVPRHVRFVTEWPMSATAVRKGPLRDRIAAELGE